MEAWINFFRQVVHAAFADYFEQERTLPIEENFGMPEESPFATLLGRPLDMDEHILLLLALMPHLAPKELDLFFVRNKNLDRPYTEFGGWKGIRHTGFLPTGETAAFLLGYGDDPRKRRLYRMLADDHVFVTRDVLALEGQERGEPFLSGRLVVSGWFLQQVLQTGAVGAVASWSSDFPAAPLRTALQWEDLIVTQQLKKSLDDISAWLENGHTIRARWGLDALIKPGYRCLFYGPPGTGKTMAATLLGKRHGMEVYRIDLSMVVSKYIGETEKNLAKVFDRAVNRHWILFFDEADALFGKRTETQSSNDRYANQEVAYLLQRVESFPGVVVLATNLKDNLDQAFLRRFQQVLHFPLPDSRLRYTLWQRMLPPEWLVGHDADFLHEVAEVELSGGTMVNVIQHCAIRLHGMEKPQLTLQILKDGIRKEEEKEGKLVDF